MRSLSHRFLLPASLKKIVNGECDGIYTKWCFLSLTDRNVCQCLFFPSGGPNVSFVFSLGLCKKLEITFWVLDHQFPVFLSRLKTAAEWHFIWHRDQKIFLLQTPQIVSWQVGRNISGFDCAGTCCRTDCVVRWWLGRDWMRWEDEHSVITLVTTLHCVSIVHWHENICTHHQPSTSAIVSYFLHSWECWCRVKSVDNNYLLRWDKTILELSWHRREKIKDGGCVAVQRGYLQASYDLIWLSQGSYYGYTGGHE